MSAFDPVPGPEETYHLWGDYEYDFTADDDHEGPPTKPKRATWPAGLTCEATGLRAYITEQAAKDAIYRIRDWLLDEGRHYYALAAVRCTEADHWHTRRA